MANQNHAIRAIPDDVLSKRTAVTIGGQRVIGVSQASMWIRAAELAAGFCSNTALNFVWDWLLYPFVIFKYGPLWGGLAMSLASFAACIGLLGLYDLLKRDWLGIEAVKTLRDGVAHGRIRRAIASILRWGDIPAFIALSLYFDPFITVAYLRRQQFGGMGRREWGIFIASWAVANGVWIVVCFLGVRGLQGLWRLL